MAVIKKEGQKRRPSPLSASMKVLLERDPSLKAKASVDTADPRAEMLWALESGGRPADYQVLDLAPVMAMVRIRRAAGLEPEFSPRAHLGRARISVPLIERLIAADAADVLAGRLSQSECMGSHHQAAADEIRFIREAGSGEGGVQAVDWSNSGGGSRGTPLWPSGGGGGDNYQAKHINALCFAPWQAAMLENPPRDGRGKAIDCALFVVMSAVLQGPALRTLESMAGIRNGQARRLIRVGLSRYTTFEELMSTRRKPRKAGL